MKPYPANCFGKVDWAYNSAKRYRLENVDISEKVRKVVVMGYFHNNYDVRHMTIDSVEILPTSVFDVGAHDFIGEEVLRLFKLRDGFLSGRRPPSVVVNCGACEPDQMDHLRRMRDMVQLWDFPEDVTRGLFLANARHQDILSVFQFENHKLECIVLDHTGHFFSVPPVTDGNRLREIMGLEASTKLQFSDYDLRVVDAQ